MDKVIFAHLKINSFSNKFDKLCDMIKGNIDVLMIPKSKLGKNFLDGEFLIEGYGTPF